MNRLKTVVFVVLLISLLPALSAQEIEKSTKKELIGGAEYYLHTVITGQTIYGISKTYTVSMEDILTANPDVKKGLKAGSVLKIPVKKSEETKKYIVHTVARGETLYEISFNYNVKVNDILAINPSMDEKIKPGQVINIPVPEKKQAETEVKNTHGLHIVQKGETIYAIAKKYNTSIDELKKLNPGLTETVQVGQQIIFPVGQVQEKPEVKKDSVIVVECGKTGMKDAYRIALLIPMYLDKSYSIDTSAEDNSSSHKSLSFIQFYEGARIAIDSLENCGLALTVYVYDVNENTDIKGFLNEKAELKNMDLIIGPFFINSFIQLAGWAEENNINIINPFTKKESVIKNNSHTFKVVSSDSAQAAKVISFVATNYPGCNLIVVNRNADSSLVNAFNNSAALANLDKQVFGYSVVNYSAKGYAGISEKLKDTINVILALAEGEAFVSTFIRSLNETAHYKKIVLFGQSSWEQYPSLDLEYLMNLNLHVFESYFISYDKPETKYFIKKFRDKYHTDPDYYGFQGYDIMMFFANALKKYGKNFQECLIKCDPQTLISEYIFKKFGSGGYENISCMIYRYDDYSIINAVQSPVKEIKLVEKTGKN